MQGSACCEGNLGSRHEAGVDETDVECFKLEQSQRTRGRHQQRAKRVGDVITAFRRSDAMRTTRLRWSTEIERKRGLMTAPGEAERKRCVNEGTTWHKLLHGKVRGKADSTFVMKSPRLCAIPTPTGVVGYDREVHVASFEPAEGGDESWCATGCVLPRGIW